jgi:hypothetical protein
VKQQEFSPTLALQRLSDCHAPEQRDGNRIPWQLLRQVIWEIGGQYRMRGKSIETGDVLTVRSENEDGGKVPFQVLRRLPLKIGIQLGDPAGEGRSVMIRS